MKYKILLNTGDIVQPPWRVINERGESQYFHDLRFERPPLLVAEKDKEVKYRGWIEIDGKLVVDTIAKTAIIR